MKKLNSATCVKSTFCIEIGFVREFWTAVSTKMGKVFFVANVRRPFAPFQPTSYFGYAKEPRRDPFIRTPDVLEVDALLNVSKVGKSVVGSVAVNMVDAKLRPLTGYVQPSNAVQAVLPIVNPSPYVSASGINSTSNAFRVGDFCAPSKNTSVLVVVKKFADALCGKINLSHAVVPLKQWFGQKPGSVSALAGLRHFSTWRLM